MKSFGPIIINIQKLKHWINFKLYKLMCKWHTKQSEKIGVSASDYLMSCTCYPFDLPLKFQMWRWFLTIIGITSYKYQYALSEHELDQQMKSMEKNETRKADHT